MGRWETNSFNSDAIGKALDDYLLEKSKYHDGEEEKNSDSPRITLAPERIETEGCHEGWAYGMSKHN